MTTTWRQQWIKPGTILFAATVPVNENAFRFALAQAAEFKSCLVIFHAYDTLAVSTAQASGIVYYDYDAARHEAMKILEPLAKRAHKAGLPCRIEVHTGLPAEQILTYVHESAVDRIVMGTRSPGAVGKLFVGSVAEEVLRKAPVPVYVVGPRCVDGAYRRYAVRKILCGVSRLAASTPVTNFAAALAQQDEARLMLLHVVQPGQFCKALAGYTAAQMEHELQEMIPVKLSSVKTESIVVLGDPTEEILFRARATQVDLIVLGARQASTFEAVVRSGVAYKVIAEAECPVLALPPVVAGNDDVARNTTPSEMYIAGVF